MKAKLKPLNQQVIVITGASSGIGLATAEAAAKRGAKLVLAARSEHAIEEVAGRIRNDGGEAIAVACDVANRKQVEQVAQSALSAFGRIDTWVNNAGISVYGNMDEVSDEDNRRLFDTNFWGVCYGSFVALKHLKETGGALINIGSEVSDAVVPMLGMYSASKHAVKGFTDALRAEVVEAGKAPVAITLIQPTSVDTPFPQHAKNYMREDASLPAPMIDPEQVADAILNAAEKATREKKVGMLAKLNTAMAKAMPRLGEKSSAKRASELKADRPPRDPEGALYRPSEETQVVGQTHGVHS